MRILLVGAGAMGGALLEGWIAAGYDDIAIRDADSDRVAELVEQFGVWDYDNAPVRVSNVRDVVVLAVKPHQVDAALKELKSISSQTIVVCVAAGVPISQLVAGLSRNQPVFRAMPNTPALVGQGMTGIVPGPGVTKSQREQVSELLAAVGQVAEIPEAQIDALTGVSGSGPAYLFYLAEAMVEAGVQQGLNRELASQLVGQTLLGSATLLTTTDEGATQLRERVTSPAGTTAAAIAEFDNRAVKAAVGSAIAAAVQRSKELAAVADPLS